MPEPSSADLPAIAGGTPAKQSPYGKAARYGEEELQELREALEQGTLFYAQGRKVRALEEAFAAWCGVEHAVACSSGTAAVHAALIAAGISPGDEVITTPITDLGTIVPILYQGAVPVFADLEPHTYNLCPAAVEAALTERTRAIVAVHLFGNSCDLHALREVADRHQLALIEDCAQAHGCRYDGRSVGAWGDIGCFSFNEYKHISCGDGGMVVARDADLARRLRQATDKGYSRDPQAPSREAAFLANNYRLTELQGAVALAQLRKLPAIVAQQQWWCGQLVERLRDVPGLDAPRISEGCSPSWWHYAFRVRPDELGAGATEFAQGLQAEGLRASAHYIGRCVYQYPLFTQHGAYARGQHPFSSRDYRAGLCPTAEAILDTIVTLPMSAAYNETDLEESALAIRRLARYCHGRRPAL